MVTDDSRRRSLGLIAFALFGLAALLLLTPNAQATFPGYNGKIAAASSLGSSSSIAVMNSDGSGLRDLHKEDHTARFSRPAFSADGKRLVFDGDHTQSGIYVTPDLFMVNVDGTGFTRVETGELRPQAASFLRDGQHILFSASARSTPGNGQTFDDLYVGRADGTGTAIPVTGDDPALAPASDQFAEVSPDGAYVAFRRTYAGSTELEKRPRGREGLYVMQSGIGAARFLTAGTSPSFSPDGKRIAFATDGPLSESAEIAVINVDGTGMRRLTGNQAPDSDPAFSPDGRQIVYSSYRGGYNNLFLINADGTKDSQLTHYRVVAGGLEAPTWQALSRPLPSSRFILGHSRLRPDEGTARIPITVFGPGQVTMTGAGVLKVSRRVSRAGQYLIVVRPTSHTKRRLRDVGRVTLTLTIGFTRDGGLRAVKRKVFVLRLNRG